MTTRTQNITEQTGCIEDRSFIGAENGELQQVPGADIFFSFARDIVASANNNDHAQTLEQSVLADVSMLGGLYTVHNAADHGGEFDGCGFAARIVEIAEDASSSDTFDEVFTGSNLDEEHRTRALELVRGIGTLLTSDYFAVVGGALVEKAVDAGASLVTYKKNHEAAIITADTTNGQTYDSTEANDPQTPSAPSYNLDVNHAVNRAETFSIDETDSMIIARLLATSTVRILSNGAITKLTEV